MRLGNGNGLSTVQAGRIVRIAKRDGSAARRAVKSRQPDVAIVPAVVAQLHRSIRPDPRASARGAGNSKAEEKDVVLDAEELLRRGILEDALFFDGFVAEVP